MVYDVIVVGAGSMGMAAGYFLTQRGLRTLILDMFDPPHDKGSHHGDTRIIRHAYGEGKDYVPLALRAQELWRRLEAAWGGPLFLQTGVLNLGQANSPFIQEIVSSARAYNLPLEVLSAGEVGKRWPGVRVPADLVGCYEPGSGVLKCEECIRAFRHFAEAQGAQLLTQTRVEDVEIHPGGITVRAAGKSFFGEALFLSAGAWAPKVLGGLNLNLPLQPIRKTVSWFDVDDTEFGFPKFPAFTFHSDDGSYYGFPSFDGSGLKIGRHDTGQAVDPDEGAAEYGAFSEDEGDVREFLRRYMPHAEGSLIRGKTCLYTMTPDEDFVVDRHPEHPNVVVAAGFSGHGFKFSSVIGEIVSHLLTSESSPLDISRFAISRFSPSL